MSGSYAGTRGVGLDSLFPRFRFTLLYGAFESELFNCMFGIRAKSRNQGSIRNEIQVNSGESRRMRVNAGRIRTVFE